MAMMMTMTMMMTMMAMDDDDDDDDDASDDDDEDDDGCRGTRGFAPRNFKESPCNKPSVYLIEEALRLVAADLREVA